MIQIRRSADRGHANHGWLDSFHTFSFADYYDPEFVQFGDLRVINQDLVLSTRGFGTHGHWDMEIVSYVLDGVLEHDDSMGNGARMHAGEIQLISAGTGITHSEFNGGDAELHFLQMWVTPMRQGTPPRYEQREFPVAERRGRLRLVVSPDGRDGSLTICQDASLFAGLLDGAERVEHVLGADRQAWLHVARGELQLNGARFGPGDGAAIRAESRLEFTNGHDAEYVLWDLRSS